MTKNDDQNTSVFNDRMESIHRAVAIILWAVLTHVFVWPFAAAISSYLDKPLLSYDVMVWAVVIATVLAFLVCRYVFPITYPTEANTDPKA